MDYRSTKTKDKKVDKNGLNVDTIVRQKVANVY